LSILGLGMDVVSVQRFRDLLERYPDRFLERCFRPDEISYIQGRGQGAAASAASRWAAKEAFLKTLGRDVRHIPYRDVEVQRQAGGPVRLILHGRARQAALAAGVQRCHLSLSHEREYAAATVILEK
jgi:holo-[acyl-carrier protein] synthase